MNKRKRPEPKSSMAGLNEEEKKLFDLIRSKEGRGATNSELKIETGIIHTIVTRSITSLKKSGLIKEIPNMNNKGIKHYLAAGFEPCKELTGGDWYTDGALDISKIEDLKMKCVLILKSRKNRAITLDFFCRYFTEQEKLTKDQTINILDNLVLDNVIMKVKSTGLDEFAATKIGEICYRLTDKKSGNGEARVGAFASVPCGVCPHIGLCSPGGVISPTTCVYYQKWLDF